MNSTQYLEAVKSRHNLASDYAAAKFLGVTISTARSWAKGSHSMNDEMALKMAELLDIKPEKILLDIHAERAKDSKAKKVFEKLAATFGAVIMSVILSAFPASDTHANTTIQAYNANTLSNETPNTVYYVKLFNWFSKLYKILLISRPYAIA